MIEDWRDFVWIDESDDRLSGARDDLVSENALLGSVLAITSLLSFSFGFLSRKYLLKLKQHLKDFQQFDK